MGLGYIRHRDRLGAVGLDTGGARRYYETEFSYVSMKSHMNSFLRIHIRDTSWYMAVPTRAARRPHGMPCSLEAVAGSESAGCACGPARPEGVRRRRLRRGGVSARRLATGAGERLRRAPPARRTRSLQRARASPSWRRQPPERDFRWERGRPPRPDPRPATAGRRAARDCAPVAARRPGGRSIRRWPRPMAGRETDGRGTGSPPASTGASTSAT